MSDALYPPPTPVAELRKERIIEAWIKNYQNEYPGKERYADCRSCGWPHHPQYLCGRGSTFGSVRLGGELCGIDSSNVEYMLHLVKTLGPGFHWRDEIFFDLVGDKVEVRRLDYYNNTPSVKTWNIPLMEWKSIVDWIESRKSALTRGDET